MAYLYNGQPVNIRVEFFRTDGVRYNNLLDAAIRTKVGIVENGDPDPFEPAATDYDQRFYWGPNNPKQLEDITVTPEEGRDPYTQTGMKTQWIAQVKDTAGKMLAQTDWYVIRKAERGVEIPADIVEQRAKILANCQAKEIAIRAASTVEEFIAAVS